MLSPSFIIFAILLRLLSGASYMSAVLRGKARPSLVSWSFWAITAIIAFIVQLCRHNGWPSLITLAIGIGPTAVVILALYKGKYDRQFTRLDQLCTALTIIGIVAWLCTKQPLVALGMSIVVDILASVPTIVKCYRRPYTEHTHAYVLSIISMGLTLLTVDHWHEITAWAFSAYILCIDFTFAVLILSRAGQRMRRLTLNAPWAK